MGCSLNNFHFHENKKATGVYSEDVMFIQCMIDEIFNRR